MCSPEVGGKQVLAIEQLKTGRAQVFEDEGWIEHVIFHLGRPRLVRRPRNGLAKYEAPIGLERIEGMFENGHSLGHFVVRVHDEDAVERTGGQVRIVFGSNNNFDICDSGLCQPQAETFRNRWIDINRVDLASCPDGRGKPNREEPIARAHICNGPASMDARGGE